MLHGAFVGEEAGARNRVFFRVKCQVAAGGHERYLVCAAGVAAIVLMFFDSPFVFCNVWLFMRA